MDNFCQLVSAMVVASCLSANIIHATMSALDHIKFLELYQQELDAKRYEEARALAVIESSRLINLRRIFTAASAMFAVQVFVVIPLIFLKALPVIFLHTLLCLPLALAVSTTRRFVTKLALHRADKLAIKNRDEPRSE